MGSTLTNQIMKLHEIDLGGNEWENSTMLSPELTGFQDVEPDPLPDFSPQVSSILNN